MTPTSRSAKPGWPSSPGCATPSTGWRISPGSRAEPSGKLEKSADIVNFMNFRGAARPEKMRSRVQVVHFVHFAAPPRHPGEGRDLGEARRDFPSLGPGFRRDDVR